MYAKCLMRLKETTSIINLIRGIFFAPVPRACLVIRIISARFLFSLLAYIFLGESIFNHERDSSECPCVDS